MSNLCHDERGEDLKRELEEARTGLDHDRLKLEKERQAFLEMSKATHRNRRSSMMSTSDNTKLHEFAVAASPSNNMSPLPQQKSSEKTPTNNVLLTAGSGVLDVSSAELLGY